MAAPWTTLSPTPPQPTTATVSPGRMSAVLRAAPVPVSTPQPSRAATVRSRSSGILTTPSAGTMVTSENVPDAAIWRSGCPLQENRVVPSSRPPLAMAAVAASQSWGWPRPQ